MNNLLERLTGKTNMYTLTVIVLCFVVSSALGMSVSGSLAFSPLELLASVAVLVSVSVASNWLIGKLYGTTAHTYSALITALILFCIVNPTLDTAGLLGLALVALYAQASKYVLACRGRHIFNPVAIAAVAIELTGASFTTWWVATPLLIPVVAIGGFLLLHKTRQLTMGTVFLVTAVAIIVTRGVIDGQTVLTALTSAFTSWPVLFFVGFMLSEPLTLSPRRWQRVLLALVVGVLFALPFSLGPLRMSPELALVIGNLIAFLLGQRRRMQLTLSEVRNLTPSSKSFVFRTSRAVRFLPGQYLELSVPHSHADSRGTRRMFSIVSAPGGNTVELAIKTPQPCSTFKEALQQLPLSSELTATRVGGDFLLPKNLDKKILMIAGGIGITPFISQLLHMERHGETRNVILLYLTHSTSELAYIDVLQRLRIPTVVISSEITERLAGIHYVEAARLSHELLEKIPALKQRVSYVSGPPNMVSATKTLLRAHNVRKIHTDYFSGY